MYPYLVRVDDAIYKDEDENDSDSDDSDAETEYNHTFIYCRRI